MKKMKKILVATDFSSSALNAVNYAADMALAINAEIILFHIYQMPLNYSELTVAINLETARETAEIHLMELKDQLIREKDNKLSVGTELRLGSFFYELKSFCEEINPYSVVMGSQGKTATERLFFGSNSVYAMKNLTWPLITIPPQATFSKVKKIAFACDYDETAEKTPIDEIRMLVHDFKAELHILNTGKKDEYKPEIVFESRIIEEKFKDLKPKYHFITSENTDEAILDFAEKNDIDLLLIVPKQHNFLEKLIHKSHSKQLILHSQIPVLAIHQ